MKQRILGSGRDGGSRKIEKLRKPSVVFVTSKARSDEIYIIMQNSLFSPNAANFFHELPDTLELSAPTDIVDRNYMEVGTPPQPTRVHEFQFLFFKETS